MMRVLHQVVPMALCVGLISALSMAQPVAQTGAGSTAAAPTNAADDEPLEEIHIEAAEPRFVAPTRRDQIGRIWAPVYLDGHGPFRLVLDSGAARSGVTLDVAQALGLPLDRTPPVLLRGVTGVAKVPTVEVQKFEVGDLLISSPIILPIITDALGGAQGILGTGDLRDRRIRIEFRNDLIIIARSHNERAPSGFVTLPFKLLHDQLPTVEARVGHVRVNAIIDTGGQITVANLALRDALFSQRSRMKASHGTIEGVTTDVQPSDTAAAPPIMFGPLTINDGNVTFSDLRIFDHWQLTQEPTMFIGMDVLGLLDTLIIDYKRHELQIRMRDAQQPD